MKRRRVPYARRSVWYVIAVLSILLVVGFVAAGYEINHLRTQADGLQHQVNDLQARVAALYELVLKLSGK
jgi:hypothetical protein